jgi:hypothetical protein
MLCGYEAGYAKHRGSLKEYYANHRKSFKKKRSERAKSLQMFFLHHIGLTMYIILGFRAKICVSAFVKVFALKVSWFANVGAEEEISSRRSRWLLRMLNHGRRQERLTIQQNSAKTTRATRLCAARTKGLPPARKKVRIAA